MNPGDRHWNQAYRALATILPPSKFHGKPANSLYYTLAASCRGDKHYRDIKASEHLDNARCGVMGVSAEFSLPNMAYFSNGTGGEATRGRPAMG